MTKPTLGRPKKVELTTNWNLDPLLKFAYNELVGDQSHWLDLYENGPDSDIMRTVRFPQSIDLTMTYEDRIIVWSCFQTEEWSAAGKTYEDVLDEWLASDIDLVPVGRGETIWRKEMFGLVFAASSMTMTKE